MALGAFLSLRVAAARRLTALPKLVMNLFHLYPSKRESRPKHKQRAYHFCETQLRGNWRSVLSIIPRKRNGDKAGNIKA